MADMILVRLRPASLLVTGLLSIPAWGLDPKLALTQLGHDVWTTSNGLPHDSVRAIAQTADRYLWFATIDGLARFDGVNFTVFSESNTPLLKQTTTISLQAAPDGSLWIGTSSGGLLRYRNGGFEKLGVPGLPSVSIRTLLLDSRGVLWIGADGGLVRLEGGRSVPVFMGGWDANVHVLLEYPAGVVWVGANDGLHRFEGGVERVFTTKDGLPDNSIWGLAPGAGGGLWIGTHTGGLVEYRQGRFRTYGQRDGFTPSSILTLLTDRNGALWIGTDGGGVGRFAEGKFTSYQTRDGLSNQVIRCLYEDHEGSLWMGTAGGGINRFKEYRVTMRTMREGLPSDSIRSLQQDHSGDIWLGTPAGIARLRASGGVEVYCRSFVGSRKAGHRASGSLRVPSVCCLSNGMARCGPLREIASSGFRATRWRSSANHRAWPPCRLQPWTRARTEPFGWEPRWECSDSTTDNSVPCWRGPEGARLCSACTPTPPDTCGC